MALLNATIAFTDAFFHSLLKKAVHGFAVRDWITRKLVAQVVERKFEPIADHACIRNRVGQIMEQFAHMSWRAKMPRGVNTQQMACHVQSRAVPNGGEDIHDLSILFMGIAHAVGGNDGQPARGCKAQQSLVPAFFLPQLMALEFDIYIVMTVDTRQTVQKLAGFLVTMAFKRCRKRTLITTCQADKARGEFFEVFECSRTFSLGCFTHFEACDQLAQVLVSSLRCTEQDNARRLTRTLMR